MIRFLRAALMALALASAGSALAAPPPAATLPASQGTPGADSLAAGEDPALGTTVPDLGESPGRDLAGKPIRRVEVITVGGRWEAPLAVTSVKPGDPASPEAARRIMREALATGRFARANVEAYLEDGAVVLRLNVLPRRLAASVQITGGALETGETLEAADIREGGELTTPKLEDIAKKVHHFYEVHGFPAAQVSWSVSDTDRPDKVILSITVTPGKPRNVAERVFVIEPFLNREVGDLKNGYKVGKGDRVDEPGLGEADRELAESLRQHGFFRAEVKHAVVQAGAWTYLYVYVQSGPRLVPAFDGNRAFDHDELTDALNLKKSPESRAGELTERLRTFYVTRGYLDVEVSMVEKGQPLDGVHYLAFTVNEHHQVRVKTRTFPCLTGELSRDNIDIDNEMDSFLEEELPGFEAPSPVDARVVGSVLGTTQPVTARGMPADLNPTSTYAPETYDRAIKHVRDLLHSKGYLNAVVGPLGVVRATCSKRSPAGVCLPEKPKAKLDTRCLKDALGLPVPEPPVPDALQCRPDPAHDVPCSPEITLPIPIALGPQTTLYDLAFDGNKSLSSAKLAAVAELPLGSPLSTVEMETARVKVLDAYRAEGFAYAEVRAESEPSPDRTRARVRFSITERDKVIVAGFVVKGNAKTNEAIIRRRIALKAGHPFRSAEARQTEERVASLGVFSSVSVTLEDAEVPNKSKRVVITVVEQPTQSIEARPGVSTGDGLRATFEWGNRNVGGLGITVLLRVQLSYLPDFLILDPAILANYQQLPIGSRLERRNTISVMLPEIGLGSLVSLSIDAIDLNDNQRDYRLWKEAVVPTLTYRPVRMATKVLGVSRQFTVTTQLGVSTEFNHVDILDSAAYNANPNLLRVPSGETIALAQRLGLTLDWRDDVFNTKTGALFTTAVEHVNAFPINDSATIKSHFLRFSGRIAGYFHLPKDLVLALSLSAGYNFQLFGPDKAKGTPGSETYPDRLFFLGGVDTLRGFLADAVVPQDLANRIEAHELRRIATRPWNIYRQWDIDDVTVRGGNIAVNPRAELRVPIGELVSGVLRCQACKLFSTGIFLDAGNLWLDPSLADPLQLRYALGAGLRLNTPIGPVAFDYGVNLNRREWEDVGAFHFSIGLF